MLHVESLPVTQQSNFRAILQASEASDPMTVRQASIFQEVIAKDCFFAWLQYSVIGCRRTTRKDDRAWHHDEMHHAVQTSVADYGKGQCPSQSILFLQPHASQRNLCWTRAKSSGRGPVPRMNGCHMYMCRAFQRAFLISEC